MANIDVSELMNDPDFCNRVPVTRTARSVDAQGRVVAGAPVTQRVMMSVQTASGDAIKRLPEGTRVDFALQVYTRHPLRTESPTNEADMVIWAGRRYLVRVVTPYLEWGLGYYDAVLVAEEILGA